MTRDAAITSKIMSAVKSKDTRPELRLRRELWRLGYRYRVNYKNLPGKPDIVFVKKKVAIFCDGDFWHGHNWVLRGMPSLEAELETYSPFWKSKILGNVARDERVTAQLRDMGWTVIRLWASAINSDLAKCIDVIQSSLIGSTPNAAQSSL